MSWGLKRWGGLINLGIVKIKWGSNPYIKLLFWTFGDKGRGR